MKKYRITDNEGDAKHPYCLLDENDVCVAIGAKAWDLANQAFDRGAASVRHEYDLVKASEAGI